MRSAICLLLSALLLLGLPLAGAEDLGVPDYVLEGFDGENTSHDWETNLFFRRMQEDTGIRFEYRQVNSAGAWEERKQEILRGENLPDVLFKAALTDEETIAMAEEGILLDLTPYLAEYAPDLTALLDSHPEWREAITLPDGTIRALPAINELPSNNLMWINQTWLDNLRLETPSTAEELTEVLRAFRDGDPNRNGRKDEIPLSVLGMWDLRFLGHAFGITDNDYYLSLKDGRITSALTGAENRAFLTWLKTLWDENLLSHQAFSTADPLRQITDKSAAIPYGVFLSASPLNVVPAEALDQYTVLSPLTYDGKQVYRRLLGDVTRGTFALTRTCANPERMVAWVNRLYTEEGSILIQAGREGEEYMWNENGAWEWIADLETVAGQILPAATLAEGTEAPGITTEAFQSLYMDSRTGTLIEGMKRVREYSVLPVPQRMLKREDAEAIAKVQANLAPWAETAMARFIAGDVPLDDKHWNQFAAEAEERGLPELIGLWQKQFQ